MLQNTLNILLQIGNAFAAAPLSPPLVGKFSSKTATKI